MIRRHNIGSRTISELKCNYISKIFGYYTTKAIKTRQHNIGLYTIWELNNISGAKLWGTGQYGGLRKWRESRTLLCWQIKSLNLMHRTKNWEEMPIIKMASYEGQESIRFGENDETTHHCLVNNVHVDTALRVAYT